MAKEEKTPLQVENEALLTPEQKKAGWFVSEWGEIRAPQVKVDNTVANPYLVVKKGKK